MNESSNVLALIAIIVNGVAILVSLGCTIYKNISEKKYSNKQRILNSLYEKVYIELPKKVNKLINFGNPTKEQVREVKKYLCEEIKKEFEFVVFIDNDKYMQIKKAMSDLEDSIARMRSGQISCSEKIEAVKHSMIVLYQKLDRFFDFNF